VWEFFTVAGTPEPRRPGQRVLAHRRWRRLDAGTYDARPIPGVVGRPIRHLCMTGGGATTRPRRPAGDNLYHTSVIALDPDTGKIKFYHQELPHDAWDFDSAVGEFVQIDRGRQEYYVHADKSVTSLSMTARCQGRKRLQHVRPAISSKASIRKQAN